MCVYVDKDTLIYLTTVVTSPSTGKLINVSWNIQTLFVKPSLTPATLLHPLAPFVPSQAYPVHWLKSTFFCFRSVSDVFSCWEWSYSLLPLSIVPGVFACRCTSSGKQSGHGGSTEQLLLATANGHNQSFLFAAALTN